MHENVLNQVRNDAGAASQVDLVTDRQGTSLMGRPVVTSSYFEISPERREVKLPHRGRIVVGYTAWGKPVGPPGRADTRHARPGDRAPTGERGFLAFAHVGGNVTNPKSQVLLSNT